MFWLPFLAVAAVTAAGSVVSGLAARSAAEDQQERADAESRRVEAANRANAEDWNSRDYAGRLVSESEAAGFNPLTVLRAGGLSAYTGLGQSAMNTSMASPTPQTFIPNAGMALGSAFSAAANVMSGAVTQNASHVSSQKLLSMQLSASQGMHAATLASQRASPSGSGALSAIGLGTLPNNWDAGDVTVTNPHRYAGVDPNYADAEAMEARYGEPGSWLFGVRNMLADGFGNLTGTTREDRIALRNRGISAIGSFVGGLADYRTSFNPPPVTGGSLGGQSFSTGGAW